MNQIVKISLVAIIGLIVSCSVLKKTTGNSIEQSALANIYLNGINDSYEYMFNIYSGDQMNLDGKSQGNFSGGFKGILLYSGMKKAVRSYLKDQGEDLSDVSTDFYSFKVYERLAGIKGSMHEGSTLKSWSWDYDDSNIKFLHYNPEIVEWAVENMIIEPETMIGDKTAQEVFDFHLKPFFYTLFDSYFLLKETGFDNEKQMYVEAMKDPEFRGLDYLLNKYDYGEFGGNVQVAEGFASGLSFTTGMGCGFWLRRDIDGTKEIFYKGMINVLQKYDPELIQEWDNYISE